MIASTTPRMIPKNIASTVTRMVPFQNPSITGDWFIASKTNGQLNAGLVSTMCRNIAARTAITAIATQRQGWRTGTALIRPGRSVSVPDRELVAVIGGSGSRVDREVVDGSGLDAPRLQGGLVLTLLLELLQRLDDHLAELGVLLGQHVTVRGGFVDVAQRLQLPAGLLDRVRGHRRVGEHRLGPPGDHRVGGL